jgi:hypothetical protein
VAYFDTTRVRLDILTLRGNTRDGLGGIGLEYSLAKCGSEAQRIGDRTHGDDHVCDRGLTVGLVEFWIGILCKRCELYVAHKPDDSEPVFARAW